MAIAQFSFNKFDDKKYNATILQKTLLYRIMKDNEDLDENIADLIMRSVAIRKSTPEQYLDSIVEEALQYFGKGNKQQVLYFLKGK